MKSELVLIYFNGCPNADKAKTLLDQAGLDFREVCQDDLKTGDPLSQYSSPTLLRGTKIIFGSKTTHAAGGCSLNIPTMDKLQEQLKNCN